MRGHYVLETYQQINRILGDIDVYSSGLYRALNLSHAFELWLEVSTFMSNDMILDLENGSGILVEAEFFPRIS